MDWRSQTVERQLKPRVVSPKTILNSCTSLIRYNPEKYRDYTDYCTQNYHISQHTTLHPIFCIIDEKSWVRHRAMNIPYSLRVDNLPYIIKLFLEMSSFSIISISSHCYSSSKVVLMLGCLCAIVSSCAKCLEIGNSRFPSLNGRNNIASVDCNTFLPYSFSAN